MGLWRAARNGGMALLSRAIGAALLQGSLYRQLTDEPQEVFYALGIVALSGIALGVGLQGQTIIPLRDAPLPMIILLSAQTRMVGWFICAGIAYIVGTKLLGGNAGFRQLLRSTGMTFAPGVFAVFAGIPIVGVYFLSLSLLWLFPAIWVAIRETQGYDWIRALICAILAWLVGVGGSYLFLIILVSDPAAP